MLFHMHIETEIRSALAEGRWESVTTLSQRLSLSSYSRRQILRGFNDVIGEIVSNLANVRSSDGRPMESIHLQALLGWSGRRRRRIEILQLSPSNLFLTIRDLRGQTMAASIPEVSSSAIIEKLNLLTTQRFLVPHSTVAGLLYQEPVPANVWLMDSVLPPPRFEAPVSADYKRPASGVLRHLENESIQIIREAVAAAEKPAMLFSLGKDSMVMLHLLQKAYSPRLPEVKILNIDTRWKFREMNTFREWVRDLYDADFHHYVNPEAISRDINPFDHGSRIHTDITKTKALRTLLDEGKYDFVFGGARRDEEKSRAKERIFSVRDRLHAWDPKNQRPEFWDLYNTRISDQQSLRVFPLSNWTELDIWRYIQDQDIPVVPLYFSRPRPCVRRQGSVIMVDDDRFRLEEDEQINFERIRFRSLGCYPLSGGFESEAEDVASIIEELEASRVSERQSRLIDKDRGASMEQKKKEGYF